MHDGKLAAVALAQDGWRMIYLQDGMQVVVDGKPVVTLEQPATIALWRDYAGEVHAKMQRSLAPHAEAVPADEIDLDAILR